MHELSATIGISENYCHICSERILQNIAHSFVTFIVQTPSDHND